MRNENGSRLREAALSLAQPLAAVAASLVIGAFFIGAAGENVLATYGVMLKGAFGSVFYLSSTLNRATPIIFGGLAVCIAWKSGHESMGGEGQMILGAFLGALTAAYLPGPGILRILAALVVAAAAGAAYSVLAGWLWDRFGVTFIISTLMLNYIANNAASYFTNFVVKDPKRTDDLAIQTMKLTADAQIPKIFKGFSLHWGFAAALVCVALVYVLMFRTRFGYEAKMCGLNPRFARYGGVNSRRILYLVMILSGVAAALGGAFEVLGSKYRYIDQMIFSTGYAWTGMVAALLADMNPIGTCFASVLLAGLATGGSAIQRSTSIPVETVNMIEGVIMLLMSVKFIALLGGRRRVRRGAAAAAAETESGAAK